MSLRPQQPTRQGRHAGSRPRGRRAVGRARARAPDPDPEPSPSGLVVIPPEQFWRDVAAWRAA
jgi:hypothetical protein